MRGVHHAARTLAHAPVGRRIIGLALLCAAPVMASAQLPRDARAPLTAFDSAKVRALLRVRLPCLGCHVVGDSGGRIGPDLTHVASRRSADYIRGMISDPARTTPGTAMPRIAMPASMRELLIAYLSVNAVTGDGAGARTPRPATTEPVVAASGAALYARHCIACHGARGAGDGPNARFLPVRPAAHADPVVMSLRSDDRLFDAIHAGGYPLGRSVAMPAFGETLTRAEIWQLVRHLRTLCRCEGPAWSRRESAASPASRTSPPR